MADTNRFNFHKHLKPVRLALAGILALMLVVVTGIHSYAAMPEAAIIAGINGTDLFVGTGASSSRQAAQVKAELRGNSILYVPGGNRGWAHLGFVFDAPLDSAGLLVKAGPHNIASEWSFPCTASGGLRIAWNRGSQRGCEEGARITRSGARSQGQTDPNGESILGAKGILKAQGGGEEVIVAPPSSDSSIIQTYESANGIEVETILGNILVKSAKYPQGRLIPEGQRYSYPQDSTMPIDRNAIANSREMQDFLNPNNWSLSADTPERLAGAIANQLREYRQALGLNPTTPVIGQCNQEQNNTGGNEVSTIPFKLGANKGTINIAYNMFGVPDKLEVIYEGRMIWSTEQVPGNNRGFVSSSNTVPISFQGNSDEVTVKVTGNLTENTQWNYTVSCPS